MSKYGIAAGGDELLRDYGLTIVDAHSTIARDFYSGIAFPDGTAARPIIWKWISGLLFNTHGWNPASFPLLHGRFEGLRRRLKTIN